MSKGSLLMVALWSGYADLSSLVGKGTCHLAQCFLMLLVLDACEVTRKFKAHALTRIKLGFLVAFQTFIEIAHRNAQNLGDLVKATCRDAVNAALVFVSLLVGDANQIGHLLLGKAQHDATFADALTNITVSVCGAVCALRFFVLSVLSHFIIRYQPPVINPHFGCCRAC